MSKKTKAVGGERSTSERERFRREYSAVKSVVSMFNRVRHAEPVSCSNPDRMSRSTKWTPSGCHYSVDVDKVARRAFAGKSDEGALWGAWLALVDETSRIGDAEFAAIHILAAAFKATGLIPRQYFAPTRKR